MVGGSDCQEAWSVVGSALSGDILKTMIENSVDTVQEFR